MDKTIVGNNAGKSLVCPESKLVKFQYLNWQED